MFKWVRILNAGFWKAKILKWAKILNSRFWKAEILTSAKILHSGFWKANSFKLGQNIEFRNLES